MLQAVSVALDDRNMGRPRSKQPPEDAPELAPTLAANLVRRRTALDLSQQKAAEMLEISQKQLSQMELGAANPTLKTLERLGRVFGMAVPDLLRDLPELRSKPPATKKNP